jgi:hypothetical protein
LDSSIFRRHLESFLDNPDGYEGEASIYGVVGDGWELFSGIIGGDRISDLVRIANIKFQLSIRFKQLPGCAALLGGQAQAQSLLNNISFQDVSASTWSLSPDATSSDLQSFNAVVTGEATASTTWSTAGGSWNGGIFRTYVSSEFFATSLADSETLTMHEMDHPALNQGGHDGFPSYADIGASCSTGVYTPRQ